MLHMAVFILDKMRLDSRMTEWFSLDPGCIVWLLWHFLYLDPQSYRNMNKCYPVLILLLSSSRFGFTQAPVIHNVIPLSNTVEQYGKFEATFDMTAGYLNPYDYDDIRVSAVFTGPNGVQDTVDGFFIKEYQISNAQTGSISQIGNGVFKIRYAPDQPGSWQYTVLCINTQGMGTFPVQTFQCTAPVSPANQGFVKGDQTNYLHFDNGMQYIPVGENMAWQSSNVYLDYSNWIQKLSDNGGNYFRLWQCHWGLGLEWTNNGYEGLRKYKQDNAFYLDWLLDHCAAKGVYVMMCLNHHGQVSTTVNSNWSESPYNAANGGPCVHTWDFFTNADARAAIRNRLRYTVARWGYQRSLMAWELFNEIDWTDNFDQYKGDVSNWHAEMAAFLKRHDVRKHLITTSYALDNHDPQTWNLPDIDLTQTHYYIDDAHLENVLADGNKSYLNAYDKPTLNGEFGLGGSSGDLSSIDPNGIYFHNCLWAGLFSGAMGSAASWWWDSYIDPRNLYTHFTGLSNLLPGLPLRAKDFRPVAAHVSGAPDDLQLTTSLGWAAVADTSITILPDGSISPAGAKLSLFLYGSQYNTQYRQPPVFHVNYPVNGSFKVKTGAYLATSPKITIWVDGVQDLSQAADTNKTYVVSVPAGMHTIRVDNTGTDWVLIDGYVFSGLGSAADVYALQSADHKNLAAWIHNRHYNYQDVAQTGVPAALTGTALEVNGLSDGVYQAQWYDCLLGMPISMQSAMVSNGHLSLTVPDLVWDVALKLVDEAAAAQEVALQLDFQVYPNPVVNDQVMLKLHLTDASGLKASLLDAAGLPVQTLFNENPGAGNQELSLSIRKGLPAGIYWLKLEHGGTKGIKPIVLGMH
jgi:hypothetical protein